MNTRAQFAIASYLCKTDKPCEHHLDQGRLFVELVESAQMIEREAEAQKALDRIVDDVTKKATHAV